MPLTPHMPAGPSDADLSRKLKAAVELAEGLFEGLDKLAVLVDDPEMVEAFKQLNVRAAV